MSATMNSTGLIFSMSIRSLGVRYLMREASIRSSAVQMNSKGIFVTILSLIWVTQNGTTGGWVPDTAAGLPAVSN